MAKINFDYPVVLANDLMGQCELTLTFRINLLIPMCDNFNKLIKSLVDILYFLINTGNSIMVIYIKQCILENGIMSSLYKFDNNYNDFVVINP